MHRWASLSRADRYRARSGQAGEVEEDPSNPLPHMQDRITCAPMTNPAISIYGHVLNHGTWKVRRAAAVRHVQVPVSVLHLARGQRAATGRVWW